MPNAGDIIYASDVAALRPTVVTKPALTSRSSTTTYQVDPDLQNITLGVGTWVIKLLLFWTSGSGTNPGIKTQWSFSGTWNNPSRALIGPSANGTVSPTVASLMNTSASASNGDASYSQSANAVFAAVREETFNAVVTASGQLGLLWAQNVSSTAATNVQAGTSFEILQIA